MNTTGAVVDLDDVDGLIAADREAQLRAAAMAGAQVRATAAAVQEGALDALRAGGRPRTVLWLAGRGVAETAGAMLAATLGGAAAEPIVLAAEVPPWIGALDVLIVAGDDPGDPVLAAGAAAGVRRGARVVVAAPYAGPLRDATAGRAAVLEPRLRVPDEFGLCRYLAAGLATLHSVDAAVKTDLWSLADALDAEALRNSVGRDSFTNPAKMLAARMAGRQVALAGDCAATLALARHGSAVLLRVAHQAAAATGLVDAVAALHGRGGAMEAPGAALFHDEQLEGPLPQRLRVVALTLAGERTVVAARVAMLDDIDVVSAADVPEGVGDPADPSGIGHAEQQLALLAVRLEMAAVYWRLMRR
ncbi:MAG: TobH protein [Mycobacteriaceae bacterium]|nr:TobH protein [Mycobacteriaceae bacterium]